MRKKWVTDADRFLALTEVLRASITGGVAKKQEIDSDRVEYIEEGVEEGIFKKESFLICPGCNKKYTRGEIPPRCENCRTELIEEKLTESSVRYADQIWPDELKSLLEEHVENFEIVLNWEQTVDDVPISQFHTDGDLPHIHVSPYFDISGQEPFIVFPEYKHAFLSWAALPNLVTNAEDLQREILDFLKTGDLPVNLFEPDGGSINEVFYSGPEAPGPAASRRSEWYTLLHKAEDKSQANTVSKQRFGINYNEMFERLGTEFLHTLFPHASTLHLGGNSVPDGLLNVRKEDRVETYIVESKCYWDGFAVFEEMDKACRYVDRFERNIVGSEEINLDLSGYIFLADSFDVSRMESDIDRFLDRTSTNLDVMCIDSSMMKTAVEEMAYLYRREPSATYRIYNSSNWYFQLLEALIDNTGLTEFESDWFSEKFIPMMIGKGHDESDLEMRVREGLQAPLPWEDAIEEDIDQIPDDYKISAE